MEAEAKYGNPPVERNAKKRQRAITSADNEGDSDDDYNEEASEYDDDYNYYEEEEESCHEPPSRRQRVIRSTRRAETVESEDEPDEPVTISRLIVKGVKRTHDTRFRIPKLCEDGYVRKIKSTPSKPILMLADSGADEHCVQSADLLSNVEEFSSRRPPEVKLFGAGGDPLPVSCKGVLNDYIDRVYHVNSLDMNMLSTNRLREKDCWFI